LICDSPAHRLRKRRGFIYSSDSDNENVDTASSSKIDSQLKGADLIDNGDGNMATTSGTRVDSRLQGLDLIFDTNTSQHYNLNNS